MTPSVSLEGRNKNLILLVTTIILSVAVFVVADDENSELRPQIGMTLLAQTQNLEAELAQLEGGIDNKILEVKNG